jgi:hypothetical protein
MESNVHKIVINDLTDTVDFESHKITKYKKVLRFFALKYLSRSRKYFSARQRRNFFNSRKLFFHKNLVLLGWSTGTAKFEFNFLDFYKTLLPVAPKKILEIGVEFGNSIIMWRGYFPDSKIFGLDHFTGVYSNGRTFQNASLFIDDVKSKSSILDNHIQLVEFDQSNQEDYLQFTNYALNNKIEFDFVIDDGSHQWADQVLTIKYFSSLMRISNSKSVLIIEDLHSSLYPTVYKSEIYSLCESPLELIQHLQLFIRKGNIKSFSLLKKLDLLAVTENLIDVKIFRDNSHFTAALIYQLKS